jgi:Stage II sporulation protein E (SpoIIE)/Concanavalin A-like lectin/glucanases superfamily
MGRAGRLRFFDVGRPYESINVTHGQSTPNLMYEVWAGERNAGAIHVIGLLRPGVWQHIAIQCGRRGMRLFFNGVVIASNAVPTGFIDLGRDRQGWIGKSAWDPRGFFSGAVADFRVWNRARTADEVARDMYDVPPGSEGLKARWKFDRSAEDAAGGPPAVPVGPIGYAPARLPNRTALAHPAILRATVRDAAAGPVDGALVELYKGEELVAAGLTGGVGEPKWAGLPGHGRFLLAVYDTNQPLRLEVRHPLGSVSRPLAPFSASEQRLMDVQLPAESGADSTNAFVLDAARLGQDSRAWVRQLAVDAASRFPESPTSATLVSTIFALDPARDVREYAAGRMALMAPRSDIAAVALLESGMRIGSSTEADLQDNLRRRPIPDRLKAVYARRTFATAMLFVGILGAFTVLHSLFFLFDPRNKAAGYTALFTGVGSLGVLLDEQPAGSDSFIHWLAIACLISSYLLALRLLYHLFGHKLPLRFWFLSWGIVAVGAAVWFMRQDPLWRTVSYGVAIILILTILWEMFRLVLAAWRDGKAGSRLVGAGFMAFAAIQMLAPFGLTGVVGPFLAAWVFPSSLSCFVLAAGVHVARDFVRTHRALARANAEIARSQELLQTEITNAAAYVRSLLPAPLESGAIRVSWLFNPSEQLGGDSFGYHAIDRDRFALYLLDVCGHGVSSALLSVSALNTLRSQGLVNTDFTNPAAVLNALNKAFPMEAHNQQYFTAWYAVFDRSQRRITYAAAGHPPAWFSVQGGPFMPLHTSAPPIGAFPDTAYKNGVVAFQGTGVLWIVSDGAFEVRNTAGRSLTVEDFRAALESRRWTEPDEVLDWALTQAAAAQLEDDFSALRVTIDAPVSPSIS